MDGLVWHWNQVTHLDRVESYGAMLVWHDPSDDAELTCTDA